MRRSLFLVLMVTAVLAILTLNSCAKEKGACIPRALPQNCADDFTSGECDSINGNFYEGMKCSDLR